MGRGLRERGWTLHEEVWEEPLQLSLSHALLERWFGREAAFRRHLEEQLTKDQLLCLEKLFREQEGARLPQRLQHTLITCRKD
jgi:hypothetical protein